MDLLLARRPVRGRRRRVFTDRHEHPRDDSIAAWRVKLECAYKDCSKAFGQHATKGWNMHTAAELGIDDFQSTRSPDERYRTTPLGGLFTRQKGGFYHDGRFADLGAVVRHYDKTFKLGLTAAQQADLVQYLKSL
jgi:hypothetical protein